MAEHKNKSRAPLKPLNVPTLALSVGGLGFLRPAPGTWGSMPPPAVGLLMALAGSSLIWMHGAMAVLLLVSSASCVLWGGYAERRFGRKDAPEVVADETAGCAIVVFEACSHAQSSDSVIEIIGLMGWAFVLFRIVDIVKPWPICLLERLPRGWGVLLDDIGAGVVGLLLFNLSMYLLTTVGLR